jgi:hypothetical protein
MTDAPTPPAGPPAGWYPDPYGQLQLRWWDGWRWTEHVQAASGPVVRPSESEAASSSSRLSTTTSQHYSASTPKRGAHESPVRQEMGSGPVGSRETTIAPALKRSVLDLLRRKPWFSFALGGLLLAIGIIIYHWHFTPVPVGYLTPTQFWSECQAVHGLTPTAGATAKCMQARDLTDLAQVSLIIGGLIIACNVLWLVIMRPNHKRAGTS